jgi:rhodanese-related sulfurtransferase
VYANLGSDKQLVIDIRNNGDYTSAHIDGAVNLAQNQVLSYLDSIAPGNYSKIAFVCYSGQNAGYVVGVLRLLGYANTYVLKWGMSGWNKQFATDKWLANISDKYTKQLDTVAVAKPAKGSYPELKTGKTKAQEILEARAAEILNIPFNQLSVKADSLMANASQFYIVNYWPEDKYHVGHIPGAYQYTPRVDLSRSSSLATLPSQKPIAVYCFTGQNASFTVAYLRLLGYNASSMVYGTNALMHQKMVAGGEGWGAFTPDQIQDFPTISGSEPSLKKADDAAMSKQAGPAPEVKAAAPKPKKSKAVSGGC